ncbi:MAG: coproporphyrinogen III oxidase [Alphaproteobacteria bacterium TMED62]|nr:MAG: coproporphyrinogen III oxidase [Alphaproteobacteria bacterium TMED62]
MLEEKFLIKVNKIETNFLEIRNLICSTFQSLENEFNLNRNLEKKNFSKKKWRRDNNKNEYGGGVSSILKGNLFEKVGVNISTVSGILPDDFKNKIKGASNDPRFFATGISVVAHMFSPFIPAAHYNSRFIVTQDAWFGGGCDLTPVYNEKIIKHKFHSLLKNFCDQYDKNFYNKYSKLCSEYFFLKHRNEERGVGGIFFDYLDANAIKNFNFTAETGSFFCSIFKDIIKKYQNKTWNLKHREKLLKKRSRYVEFNLLYDKGTTFGLKTNGNVDAILMSMPPIASWD